MKLIWLQKVKAHNLHSFHKHKDRKDKNNESSPTDENTKRKSTQNLEEKIMMTQEYMLSKSETLILQTFYVRACLHTSLAGFDILMQLHGT